jgi:hypothetical protein
MASNPKTADRRYRTSAEHRAVHVELSGARFGKEPRDVFRRDAPTRVFA